MDCSRFDLIHSDDGWGINWSSEFTCARSLARIWMSVVQSDLRRVTALAWQLALHEHARATCA
eukprot:2542547-Alexandrium_andersonii.AAC.1